MESNQSQMAALLQSTAVAGQSQTIHRWAELWSNEKEVNGKCELWVSKLFTAASSRRSSHYPHLPLLCSAPLITCPTYLVEWV